MDHEAVETLFRQLLPSLSHRPFWLRFGSSSASESDPPSLVSDLLAMRKLLESRGTSISAKPGFVERWFGSPNGAPGPEWMSSRECLKAVLRTATEDSSSKEICHLSISHTHGFALAAGLCCRQDESVVGIGVDSERLGRVVSERVTARIRNGGDALILKPIAIWAIKEACYKADPDSSDRLSDYRIEHPIHEGAALGVSASGPGCRFEAGIAPIEGCWVAVAVAKR